MQTRVMCEQNSHITGSKHSVKGVLLRLGLEAMSKNSHLKQGNSRGTCLKVVLKNFQQICIHMSL